MCFARKRWLIIGSAVCPECGNLVRISVMGNKKKANCPYCGERLVVSEARHGNT